MRSTLRLKSLLLVLVMVISIFSIPAFATTDSTTSQEGTRFTDVPSTHWAYDAIQWMSNNKILAGDGSGHFNPDDNVTRAQFAQIMVLALRLPTGQPGVVSFVDVSPQSWAYKAVESAKPFLTGFRTASGDYFKPQTDAVREDMAVALVKAMDYQDSPYNPDSLNIFTDRSSISPNLTKYAAIAIEKGLMAGSLQSDNTKTFGAQDSLTRAQAAALIFKSLEVSGEKITFDNENKVTYPSVTPTPTAPALGALPKATVRAESTSGGLSISWTAITDERFSGYKVVLSKSDSTPVYPDNGYFKYITDRNQNRVLINQGNGYSGGDLCGSIKANESYYLSITTLYNDGSKVPGNVIRVQIPATQSSATASQKAIVSAKSADGGILLNWSRVGSENFTYYKVVISRNDSSPVYPENGYITYIADPASTSYALHAGDTYNGGDFNQLESGNTYYVSITSVFGDNKIAGNTIQVKIP
jgi:hypothetical protein